MTDLDAFHAWLQQGPAAPATTPAPPTPPAPVAPPRDVVGEHLARFNAERAGRPNPLLSKEENAAQAAAGPPPAKTEDAVADYIAMQHWHARRRPNPLRPLTGA